MDKFKNQITILMADDDVDDFFLVRNAFMEAGFPGLIHHVSDCDELMDFLFHRCKYEGMASEPHPDLILLDLNMPIKNGKEVLAEIKSIPDLRRIPVIIYTTSKDINDIQECYDLGANTFISKPDTYDALMDIMNTLEKYWLKIATLPMKSSIIH